MSEALISLFSAVPHRMAALLLSMLPVAELRLAIPLSITVYGLNPMEAFFICCVGNLIPVPFIVLFIRPILNKMKKIRVFGGLAEKIESKGNAKKDTVLKYKFFGLFVFVAIPLPGTGAWTGALIAALLNMRIKTALPSITLGVLTAGTIVTLMTTGVLKVFGF